MIKSLEKLPEGKLYTWARWQQRAQCAVNIVLVLVCLGGPLYLFFLQKVLFPAASDDITVTPLGPAWTRSTHNFYKAKLRKYRDCPLSVNHHYQRKDKPDIEISVPAPSFARMRTTGKFRVREFAAKPPPDLAPGVYWFWAEVRYYCYGSSLPAQTYYSKRAVVRIK